VQAGEGGSGQVLGGARGSDGDLYVSEQFSRSDITLVPIADVPPSELYLCTRLRDRSPSVAALRRVTGAVAGN
jgi:hypothetical protein